MRDGVRFAGGQEGISTDALIDALSGDLSATPVPSVRRTLALAFAFGSAASAATMLALLGLRPDMASALATASFWIKLIFPSGLAVAGLMAVDRLGRPGAEAGRGYTVGIAVAGTMALLASVQLASAPRDAMRPLLLGHTLDHCTALIMLLALPILAAGMYAMRQMAPTRLRLAGAAVGVTAGALSAAIYAIACDETALPFVTLWYGAGIALTGVLGALLGPRLLRW
ncbi:NrsF family protein [Xanthobacter versatilis]|uniref:NrsF family protein n=1 Tax=Xanthobacter autotrophicus (strain ATCC BAA-1158 / Py2) TaxID=78245 RepID=UPI0037280E13